MPTSTNVTNLKINELTEAQYDTAVQGGVIGANEISIITDLDEAIQVSTMPTAAVGELGKVYQFIGTTDASYTHGYFYECVSDGGNPATYSWSQLNVQPAGSSLPSQAGNSGKFLTTDGTSPSWATISALQNTATGNQALTISGTACTYEASVNIGVSSQADEKYSVAIGYNAKAWWQHGTALGYGAVSNKANATAIGNSANANGQYAIQLGVGTNSNANTFSVGLASGSNYQLLSSNGTIPTERLTKVNTTVTLTTAGWSGGSQTVTVTGMTATGIALVSPDPSDTADYVAAGILCTSQATNSLTFTATTTPTNDIDVNIVCL